MRFLTGVNLVVVNYKTPSDLKAFGYSLLNNLPEVPTTLHIMNNDPQISDMKASVMITDLLSEKLALPVHVTNTPNEYYSGACNRGAEQGAREVIAFLNADTRFCPGTIDKCYEALISNEDWGAVGPLQYGDRKEVTHAGIFGSLSEPKHRGWNRRDLSQFRDVVPAVTLSGSALFTKRTVWTALRDCPVYQAKYPGCGAFLPTKHYYEETWYCYHMQAHGFKPVYFGEAEMVHRFHKASPKGGWADQQFSASRVMFREMCDTHGIDHD